MKKLSPEIAALKALMKQKRLTAEDVARALGPVSSVTVHRWTARGVTPHRSLLRLVREFLKTNDIEVK